MLFSSLIPFIALAAASPLQHYARSCSNETSKPTIVVSPGAFQLPPTWDNFKALSEAAGYETIVVPLLSVGGTQRPLAGLVEDAAFLKATLEKLSDEGKEIVLLSYSYGGPVISTGTEGVGFAQRQAVGKPGGVLINTFIAAFVIHENTSWLDLLGGQFASWMIVKDDYVLANASLMPAAVFNDLPPAQAADVASKLSSQSIASLTEPSTYEPWAHGIPSAYVHTTLDVSLVPAKQAEMVAILASTGAVVPEYTLVAAHDPHISIPDQLLAVIEDIADVGLAKAKKA
ncbi:hypothetical protein PVAG01_04233 [Phlyctema vagabunda]|uniref:AB hydrolase-1 domain-containing protein n=1 Tax=Phlyctema vagabunda TaxID=108571 RepID=A0ABR4PNN7_9HELO